jgi:hypothetical protein
MRPEGLPAVLGRFPADDPAGDGGQAVTNRTADQVIETLAVYRATKLLQDDTLPPLPELREKLMQRYGHTPWSQLLDCPWCLSVWVAGASVLIRHLAPRLWRIGAGVLASSAVAGVISEWLASIEPEEIGAVVKHYKYEPAPDGPVIK